MRFLVFLLVLAAITVLAPTLFAFVACLALIGIVMSSIRKVINFITAPFRRYRDIEITYVYDGATGLDGQLVLSN